MNGAEHCWLFSASRAVEERIPYLYMVQWGDCFSPVAGAARLLDDAKHDGELAAVLQQALDRHIRIEHPRLIQRERRH